MLKGQKLLEAIGKDIFIDYYKHHSKEATACKFNISINQTKIDKSKMFNDDNGLRAGDNVIHDTYGPGVVVNVDKSIATIAFKGQGIKKLMKNHKSIKKV